MSDPSDPMPDEQLRFLRASVSDRCDLACVYCPKASGMENHVPDHLRERVLTPQAYATNLDRIAATGEIRGISFTGGEPTLNPYLPDLVAHAHTRFERVELTTNGRWLGSMLDRLVPYLHVVKVSLDAADPEVARRISRGRADAHQAAVEAIRMAADAGLTVGVNVVAMRDNLDQLAGIVDLVRGLRVDAPGRLYVSVLDLYHTPETHQVWAQQYVPIETVVAALRRRLGPGQRQDRKGCEIHWFDDAGFQIRVKSSSAYTYRA
ncbi:MAG: radical SAM protein, partial [Micromonosporaceae bacterium]|nr:radical SAM protein [Micromonosporaceae bacterium]